MVMDVVWQILSFDATIGARALLQRNDILAEFTGDVISVWSCKPVQVENVYRNHKINETCYKFLSVVVDHKIMFVFPGSTDIISYSPIINCEHRPAAIY